MARESNPSGLSLMHSIFEQYAYEPPTGMHRGNAVDLFYSKSDLIGKSGKPVEFYAGRFMAEHVNTAMNTLKTGDDSLVFRVQSLPDERLIPQFCRTSTRELIPA